MAFRTSASVVALCAGIAIAPTATAQQALPGTGQTDTVRQNTTDQGAVEQDPSGQNLGSDAQRRASAQRQAAITGTVPPQSSDDAREVTVTGTRIARPNLASASPITTVTATDVAQTGAINVEDVLNRLPQVFPSAEQFNEESGSGRQRINLRRLGFNRTLTLIDGLRINQAEGVDVNAIPTALIDRIDVLSGGASSVYGSDAIGGVVNFILRKNFEGVRLTSNYSFYNHNNRDTIVTAPAAAVGITTPRGLTNDGQRVDVNLAAGTRLFDDRLSISGFVGYRQAEALAFNERDYSSCQLARGLTDERQLNCSQFLSSFTPGGAIIPRSGASAGQVLANNPNGTRTFVPFVLARNGYNTTGDRFFQRPFERINAGSFLSFEIAPAAEVFASYMFSDDKSESTLGGSLVPTSASYGAAGAGSYQVNCNNPLLSASQAQTICGAAAGSATASAPIDVLIRFPSLTQYGDRIDTQSHRATAGVRGEIAEGWRYDVSGVYSTLTTGRAPSGLPQVAKIRRALQVVNVNGVPTCRSVIDGSDPNCVPLDVFQTGNTGASIENYLFNEPRLEVRQRSQLIQALGNLTVDLTRYGIRSPFSTEGLALAGGFEYREDKQVNTADAGFYAQFGGADYNYRQDVVEGNVEAQLPLVQDRFIKLLQVNGGYRLSKYSTNDNTFSTWKIEGLFAPIQDITFRTAINRAARAPSVYEGNPNINFDATGAGQQDFCAPRIDPNTGATLAPLGSIEACRASGLADNLYGSATLICPDGACVGRLGGFTLRPEDARTITAGVVLQPRFIPGLTASIDFYQVKIKDKINFNFGDFALESCRRQLLFCDRIVRNPNGTLYGSVANPTTGFVIGGTTNEFREENRGWDFQLNYGRDIAPIGGRVDVAYNGSIIAFSGGQDAPFTLNKNCVGFFGPACAAPIPRYTHGLRTGYTTRNGLLNASFNWRHISGVDSTRNSNDPAIGFDADDTTIWGDVPAYDFFDVSVGVTVQKRMTIRLTVNNVFDRLPPILPNGRDEFSRLSRSNTVPERYDPLGRYVAIGVSTDF